jgi:hypothetical protein
LRMAMRCASPATSGKSRASSSVLRSSPSNPG